MGLQLVLQKSLVMFTKKLGEFWVKIRGVFCKHNGKIFCTYRSFLLLYLTKKQKQGRKSVKMPLTFFLLPI